MKIEEKSMALREQMEWFSGFCIHELYLYFYISKSDWCWLRRRHKSFSLLFFFKVWLFVVRASNENGRNGSIDNFPKWKCQMNCEFVDDKR